MKNILLFGISSYILAIYVCNALGIIIHILMLNSLTTSLLIHAFFIASIAISFGTFVMVIAKGRENEISKKLILTVIALILLVFLGNVGLNQYIGVLLANNTEHAVIDNLAYTAGSKYSTFFLSILVGGYLFFKKADSVR